jgi:hypothetical protein
MMLSNPAGSVLEMLQVHLKSKHKDQLENFLFQSHTSVSNQKEVKVSSEQNNEPSTVSSEQKQRALHL